jgi:hypothetical protein
LRRFEIGRPALVEHGCVKAYESTRMRRCEQCGRIRTSILNLRTNRRQWWQCLALAYEPGEEPISLETYLAIKENVLCLRCVEIETDDHFELLVVLLLLHSTQIFLTRFAIGANHFRV